MKTELRAKPHSVVSGAFVFEVWHDGVFLATITGADGPGVRIVSKHPIIVNPAALMITEIRIDPAKIVEA